MASILKTLLIAAMVFTLAACAAGRYAPPLDSGALGSIEGLENIRYWGDDTRDYIEVELAQLRRQLAGLTEAERAAGQSFLAISGGGKGGGFGAGLLTGWSGHGSRPEFRIVTGISIGAMMAPFAFLGEDCDGALTDMFTKHSLRDLFRIAPSGVFGGPAITDSEPMLRLIARYLDDEVIARIAAEYHRGRRLFVGTTNLDAKRPVTWDITAIAASDAPGKAALIHRVILASAAIPGVLPPVIFDARHAGQLYDELHVDGGIANQLFITPNAISIRAAMDSVGLTGPGTVYVIRNTQDRSDVSQVKPSAFGVSTASLDAITFNQGNTDQYVIYLKSRIDGLDYRAAQAPADFNAAEAADGVDAYMRQLFDYAHARALAGYPWQTAPKAAYCSDAPGCL